MSGLPFKTCKPNIRCHTQTCLIMYIKALEEEEVVIQRLQAGDEKSFALVYNHYYSSVQAQVLHILHSPEMTEDVTQEIFIRIWENREKLSEVRSFKSYLFITARNYTLNVLKSASRSEAAMGEIIRYLDKYRNTTQDQVQDNEYLRFINRQLEALPPRSREIFNMCRVQSKTYNEVAAELGISRDAVKSRMVHVMKTLRSSIEKETGLPLALFLALMSRL